MSLYKQEFGQDFDLGFDLKEHPYLIDKSWHNDLCPSFYFKVDEQYYVLWVDYADEERREENTTRYTIIEAINEGSAEEPEVYAGSLGIAFKSEDYYTLKSFFNYFLTR
ncbi:hypothetical protein AUR67_17430 [Pseudoalteromonas sp. XI10]|uniref:hypothetical protein n=1 Tax=Pseudoalteromonas sp. XI10 TaxID=1766621 RepID=UPI0007336A4A|nr:hypothetical protein [Pseudoalteromonas sp. XI10]KTG18936.1 hypothetical protein AUR67_17430 [Pseudoalteromonas sp. XI10]